MDRKLGKVAAAWVMLFLAVCTGSVIAKGEMSRAGAAIGLWASMAMSKAQIVDLQYRGGNAEAYGTAREGQALLDDGLDEALRNAKSSPAVQQAVKAYYIAGKAYFAAAVPGNSIERSHTLQLKDAMEQSASALELEIKTSPLRY